MSTRDIPAGSAFTRFTNANPTAVPAAEDGQKSSGTSHGQSPPDWELNASDTASAPASVGAVPQPVYRTFAGVLYAGFSLNDVTAVPPLGVPVLVMLMPTCSCWLDGADVPATVPSCTRRSFSPTVVE